MNTILDILGSVVIGGIVFFLLLNFSVFQSSTSSSSDANLQIQQNAKTLAEMLSYDLRKIGYKTSANPLITAQSKKISFRADIDRNGTEDIVTYLITDSSKADMTEKSNDILLMRIINEDSSSGPTLGLIDAEFSFFDSVYVITSDLAKIKYIKAELWIESNYPVDNKYPFTYWEMTINPRNL